MQSQNFVTVCMLIFVLGVEGTPQGPYMYFRPKMCKLPTSVVWPGICFSKVSKTQNTCTKTFSEDVIKIDFEIRLYAAYTVLANLNQK